MLIRLARKIRNFFTYGEDYFMENVLMENGRNCHARIVRPPGSRYFQLDPENLEILEPGQLAVIALKVIEDGGEFDPEQIAVIRQKLENQEPPWPLLKEQLVEKIN